MRKFSGESGSSLFVLEVAKRNPYRILPEILDTALVQNRFVQAIESLVRLVGEKIRLRFRPAERFEIAVRLRLFPEAFDVVVFRDIACLPSDEG